MFESWSLAAWRSAASGSISPASEGTIVVEKFLIAPGVALLVALLVVIVALLFLGPFLNIYIQALLSGAPVRMLELVAMRLRKVDLRTVVYSRIRAVKAGLDVSTSELETHFLSAGRVPNVISAMIAARSVGATLPWNVATAVDLAGHDPLAGILAMSGEGEIAEKGREAAHALIAAMRSAGASTDGLRAPDGEPRSQLQPLVGAVAEAVETIETEGRVRIGARTYLASSVSRLPAGTIVRVLDAGDGRLMVERA